MGKRALHRPLAWLIGLSLVSLIIAFGFDLVGKAMVAEATFRGRHLPAYAEQRQQTRVPERAQFSARDLLNNARR